MEVEEIATPYNIYISESVRMVCSGPDPFFAFDVSKPMGSAPTMQNLVVCMTSGPLRGRTIKLVGHRDPRRTVWGNERLGLERAEKVKQFFVTNGVDPTRVLTASAGVEDAATAPKEWAADRRVQIQAVPTETPYVSAPIPDTRLARAVTEAIARAAILRSQPVMVSVAKGEVTLTGTVRSLADKARAARLVADFKGAVSLTNGILVKTAARPDAEIAREVKEAIRSDPATRNASVQAAASAGTLSLRGSADSYAQRDLLAEVASRARGVQALNLAVTVSRVSSRGDAQIAADVTDELRDDARLDGTRVLVAAHARTVVLSGFVGSVAQRGAALEDALEVGAPDVDVHALRIDWGESERTRTTTRRPPPTDRNIAEAVRRLLSNDVRVGRQLPSVRVEQGVVTLSGNVTDFRADRAADRDARRVSGVWRVEDGMTILPAKRESDATIQQQVLRGIYEGVAAADSRDVQATTTNARVTLKGAVASQEDKTAFEDDVEEVPGVVALDDQLKVRGYGPETLIAAPESIRHRAIENIFWDPRVAGDKVSVDVDPDGDVTLSGRVDSWEEARAVNDDAVRAGAAHVMNRVQIAQVAGDAAH